MFEGGATAGIGNAAPSRRQVRRLDTGKVSPAELKAALSHFAPPEPYVDARDALKSDSMIVLYGEGTGRRTAAINLLNDVASGPLVTLSPPDSLEQLTGRKEYRQGYGYLLSNFSAADGTSEGTEFALSKLAERLQAAEAYLVITSLAPLLDPRSPALPQFRWERPPDVAVLTSHGVETSLAARAAELITPAHGLADVVQLAGRLCSGMELGAALAGLDLAEAERVTAWCDAEDRTDAEILEVAALLFLEGMPERRFEHHLGLLTEQFPSAEPPEGEQQEKPPRGLLAGRRPRRDDSSLITVERLASNMDMDVPGPPRRCVMFRSPGYRRHVVGALSEQFGDEFWAPVFAWIHQTMQAADPETRMQVASGLALLATHDYFDAVREVFLQPWSEGVFGVRAWVSAPHVLWWMCLDDDAAEMALRTAIRWSRSGIPQRRHAASLAFAGEVGIRYPAAASRHLWHLIEAEADPEHAQAALAQLYATLVELAPGGATGIVSDLARRLAYRPRPGSRELALLLGTTLAVLSAPEQDGHRPACSRHLVAMPAGVTDFAQLCAAALINRPVRAAAFAMLYDVLSAVGELDAEPEPLLHAISHALARKLPLHEHEPFKREFERYATRRKSGGEIERLLVAILLKIFSTSPYQERK